MIFFPLVTFFVAILNCVEISSQFECLPNGEPLPARSRPGTSNSRGRNVAPARTASPTKRSSNDRTRSPHDRTNSPSDRTSPPYERNSSPPARFPPARFPPARFPPVRFPPARLPSWYILGFEPQEVEFIRLISRTNTNRVFEIRRYIFPTDKSIFLRGARNVSAPLPTGERFVVTTSSGDIVAILEHNNRSLRGIYIKTARLKRARMNIDTGEVAIMDRDEIREIPISDHHRVSEDYRIVHVNDM